MRREYISVVIHERKFLFSAYVSFILPLDVILLKLWCRKKERGGTEKKIMNERSALRLKTIIELTYQNECSRWQFGIHRTLAPVKRVVFGEYHVREMKNAQRIRIRIRAGMHTFLSRKEGGKTKQKTYLRDLDLLHETNAQVFQDDPVRSGKERQHVRDEVLLVRGELFPVLHVVL